MKKLKFEDYSKAVDKIIATGKPVHEQLGDLLELVGGKIVDMDQSGSQTKRKRDATTGSTAEVRYTVSKKTRLDWRDRYLDKFKTTPHRGIEEFIDKLFLDILKHNKDPMTGLYDFDGIALEVISLVKK